MLKTTKKYSYRDVMIEPQRISTVSSRKECNPYVHDNYLPIFTAPMSTVVGEKSWKYYENNGIIPILPRNISIETRLKYFREGNWVAFSLQEFEDYLCNTSEKYSTGVVKALIDVANI